MIGQGRQLVYSFAACLLLWQSSVIGQMMDWPMPPEWRNDSTLNDVYFVDQYSGWAVGNSGAVLRTTDGGANWRVIDLGLNCSLNCITFSTPQHGWIVGGYRNPGAAGSTAIVMRTTDGGNSWHMVSGLTIPKLQRANFTNASQGWAVGDGNQSFSTGIYHTMDGGRTWSSPTGRAVRSWKTAHRLGSRLILIGHRGVMGFSQGDEAKDGYFPETEPVTLAAVSFQDDENAIGIGIDGSVFETRNGGLSWHPDKNSATIPASQASRLTTGAQTDDIIWLVGDPGSHIFRFQISTGQWSKVDTPLATGLQAVSFADDAHGWAVGHLGTILTTNDGGNSWSIQRQASKRLSYLHIVREPGEVCSELLAQKSGEGNELGGVIVADGSKVDSASSDNAKQAAMRCGTSVFELLESSPNDRLSHLVRLIRQYRPDVLYLPTIHNTGSFDLNAVVLQAVSLAQQTDSGNGGSTLNPWRVSEVILCDPNGNATNRISPTASMPQLAAMLGDYVVPSRLLLEQPWINHRSVALRSIYVDPLAENSASNVTPRRQIQSRSAGNLTLMKTLSGKNKKIKTLIDAMHSAADVKQTWFNSIAQVTADLDNLAAGVWVFQLANEYLVHGHCVAAAETHGYLIRNYPDHPLALSSHRWLWRYYTSNEYAHLLATRKESGTDLGEVSDQPQNLTRQVTVVEEGVVKTRWEVVPEEETTEESETDGPEVASPDEEIILRTKRYQIARAISQSLDRKDFAAGNTGRYALGRTLLLHKMDPTLSLEEQLKKLANEKAETALANKAIAELEWMRGKIAANQPVTTIDFGQSPHLDAQFQDEIWSESDNPIILLDSNGADNGDHITIKTDGEFLYLAGSIRNLQGFEYEPREGKSRQRDDDLRKRDRVEFVIDLDRDFESFFVFSVDSAGRLAESCGGCIAWDPTWYVANGSGQKQWHFEAAIPLSEMSSTKIEENRRWALSIRRFARNRLVSAWPKIADQTDSVHRLVVTGKQAQSVQPLDSFGFAEFAVPAAKTASAQEEINRAPIRNLPDPGVGDGGN